MPRFLADHNFREQISAGVMRRHPELEILTARAMELARHSDEDVLEAAARDQLVVLTHDRATLVPAAWARVAASLPMPGVVFIPALMPIGRAVRMLGDLVAATGDGEWIDRVHFLTGGSG